MDGFQLKAPKGATKKKRIVGRGDSAGKGSTCGRGHKGQKARSGGNVRPGFEGGQMPLYRRIARKGFSNYPFKKERVGINLSVLSKKYKNKETVNFQSLVEKGIVKRSEKLVKILGNGEITVKSTVEDLPIAKSAKEKIEQAGGKVTSAVKEEVEVKNKEPKTVAKKEKSAEQTKKEGEE